jgi:hypothetical protein
MRRELKDGLGAGVVDTLRSVAKHIPMRRELKVQPRRCSYRERVLGRKAHPDEKGTERLYKQYAMNSLNLVAKHIPMRRELKVVQDSSARCHRLRRKAHPDEKGTERI